ncbi:ArsR/SmtB family transcription factor [Flavobacterium gilvum]|uniref:HTH arsR-type domain-containing protein n=1 Tax=Flavobacterium gilvum TaxID=1492737 RepID=A0AAC9I2G2_9FLAO|nr:metalloregulator ArsR/SmtB family transcription factor [Flavobacterium gilvum]AOW08974.1 hypothetical protein EM308_05325 [Flavobacterium gilvum]KFC57978.1 regulatory protein ArsR [Flavobacterium gilvum]
MGTSKHINFDEQTNAIAEICKALGHPTRMQIMTLLWNKNNRTCGEIVALIPLAQSTISKHLSELKKANLLNVKNVGKKTIYSLETDKIQLLKKYLSNYLSNRLITAEEKPKVIPASPKVKRGNKPYLKQYNYEFEHKNPETDLDSESLHN